MKGLKQYEKELSTCSKCALCQSVCPVYKVTGSETAVSRGKFSLFLGLLNGDLKFTKNLQRKVDMCLNCGACEDFCPSDIKTTDIINTVKAQYREPDCTIAKIFHSTKLFRLKLIAVGTVFKLYNLFRISGLVKLFRPLFLRLGALGGAVLLLDRLAPVRVRRKRISAPKNGVKVLYFQGCYNKYVNPGTKNASLNLLDRLGVEVEERNFGCCALSHLASGRVKKFEKLKNKNLALMQGDFDYVVCDCASCVSTLKKYNEALAPKIVDISQFFSALAPIGSQSVTYHLPCHLRCDKGKISAELERIFAQNYKKMDDFDVCCGFNEGFEKNFPDISAKIMENKAGNVKSAGAKVVLTSCPACVIGLNKALLKNCAAADIEVCNFVEALDC